MGAWLSWRSLAWVYCEEKGTNEACGGMTAEENMTDKEWEEQASKIEKLWDDEPKPTIEDKWGRVERLLANIHDVYIEEAEIRYNERLTKALRGV